MAQTDARPGFRLPWNSERSNSEQTEIDETAQADGVDGGSDWQTSDNAVGVESPEKSETAEALVTTETGTPDAVEGSAPDAKPARRSTKFMVDLSKAMQAAAEEARTRTLGQFEADA